MIKMHYRTNPKAADVNVKHTSGENALGRWMMPYVYSLRAVLTAERPQSVLALIKMQ